MKRIHSVFSLKKKIIMRSFFVILCLLPKTVLSQDTLIVFTYPSEKEIDVTVRSLASFNGKFRYSYKINSSPSSQQRIWVFDVVHQSEVDSLNPPNGWIVLLGPIPILRVSWSAGDSVFMIAPGESLSGFSFSSNGLPSTGDFYSRGWVDVPGFLPEEWPDSVIGGVFPENSFHGRTLVPRTPPTPFNALTFLDTITSYISESRTLGWITNDPTANKYKRLIDTARFHLQANNRGVTKAKLDSVMVSVYPDSAAGLITSEAYALLRFNTEYLLKKLSEE